jgi:hypothetical protein
MSNMVSKGLGTEVITVSSSSIPFTTIPGDAKRAYCRVDGADIHVENDGTAVTTTTGILVRDEETLDLTDHRYNLVDFRFIRAASTDATVYVSYFN